MWKKTKNSLALVVLSTLALSTQGFQSTLPATSTRRMPTAHQTERPAPQSITSHRQPSSTSLNALPSPVGAVSVLCFIVCVHEAGHYLSSKLFGIDVQEFSVGVGPKIFGFKAFGDDFSLRALPLGGYVRYPENYNATLVEEMRAQAVEDAKAKVESEKAGGFRSTLMNILSMGAADRKRKEEEAEAQTKSDKLPWWKRMGSDDDLNVPEVEIPYDDNPNLLQNRPWQERAVVLSGGVVRKVLT